MKAKYYLVEVARGEIKHKFIMLNAHKPLTNRMCNPYIFGPQASHVADLNMSVFYYFGCTLTILNDGKPLDRRTKKYRDLVSKYRYFSVSYLPYFDSLSE